jgi:hypothetical protein
MSGLVVCSACRRHVRDVETACPFCGSAVVAHKAAAAPPYRRLAAAAAVATGVVASAGCGVRATSSYGGPGPVEIVEGDGSSTQDAPFGVPHYGAPFMGDAGPGSLDDAMAEDAPEGDAGGDAATDAAEQ